MSSFSAFLHFNSNTQTDEIEISRYFMRSVSLWGCKCSFVCLSVSVAAMSCGCMCSSVCLSLSLWVPCVAAGGCEVGRLKSNFLCITVAVGVSQIPLCLSVFLSASHIQFITQWPISVLSSVCHSLSGYWSFCIFTHSLIGVYSFRLTLCLPPSSGTLTVSYSFRVVFIFLVHSVTKWLLPFLYPSLCYFFSR